MTVPSVAGKPLSEANRILTDAGLNVKIVGYPTDRTDDLTARQAVVNRQSKEEGSTVPEGTVIEIGIVYQDATE